MGKNIYFLGANDNAAGVATQLSLAKYYVKNSPTYSVGLICFAGEEAGFRLEIFYRKPFNFFKKY